MGTGTSVSTLRDLCCGYAASVADSRTQEQVIEKISVLSVSSVVKYNSLIPISLSFVRPIRLSSNT